MVQTLNSLLRADDQKTDDGLRRVGLYKREGKGGNDNVWSNKCVIVHYYLERHCRLEYLNARFAGLMATMTAPRGWEWWRV